MSEQSVHLARWMLALEQLTVIMVKQLVNSQGDHLAECRCVPHGQVPFMKIWNLVRLSGLGVHQSLVQVHASTWPSAEAGHSAKYYPALVKCACKMITWSSASQDLEHLTDFLNFNSMTRHPSNPSVRRELIPLYFLYFYLLRQRSR